MNWLERARGSRSVRYARSDLVCVSLLAALVSAWAGFANGAFSVSVFVACQVVFFTYYLAGSLFASVPSVRAGLAFDLPLRLLVGYAFINTAQLALAWLSPLGMVANFGGLLLLTILAAFALAEWRRVPGRLVSAAALVLSAVATTVWCQDSIWPTTAQGNWVIFKPWVDSFYHAVHVRIFADSAGASSIEDFRMSGVPARLYHYGVYMLPALIKQVSAIHSYTAFAGILAPLGVLFTGLAAYAFFSSLWGGWAGVAACAALLLLPDGSQLGADNPFLSYHWLTQISPSATYGLALLAVAWLFVLRGCRAGNRVQVVVGWAFATLLVAYKLHYAVASALLLLLVPALFFRARLGATKRALWVAAALVFYAGALWLVQKVPGVPLIRFDGSAVGEIQRLIQSFAKPGPLQEFMAEHTGPKLPWTSNLLYGVPYVLGASLGLSLPLLALSIGALRRRVHLLHLLFPVLLIVNFVVMFCGLALDFESSTPDELSHRPLMLVYFFVTGWVGAAAVLLLRRLGRARRWARPALLAVATALLAVPFTFGPGVQLMWVMPQLSPTRVPAAFLQVAEHIRSGDREDVFQDSQFDRTYVLSALSERRSFVSHTLTRMPFRSELVGTRTSAINRLMLQKDARLVRGTAHAFGVRWFVLHQGNRVNWAPELAAKPALQAGPFTLYDFEPPPRP